MPRGHCRPDRVREQLVPPCDRATDLACHDPSPDHANVTGGICSDDDTLAPAGRSRAAAADRH
jgi:hypothetical protein